MSLLIRFFSERDEDPNFIKGPRGEIVIGGPHVSEGYFEMPDKTREDFFESESGVRFFRTGDIGQLRPDGSLRIIDRKKDLVKLQGGEYVSLGKVEASLKIHPCVENLCVYADPRKLSTVAIVVPEKGFMEEKAGKEGSKEDLCNDPKVVDAVLDALRQQGAQVGLERWEIPKAVTLTAVDWTPESGLVTAAFKLRRRQIQEKYQEEIDGLYAKLEAQTVKVIYERENNNNKMKKNKVSPTHN